MRLSGLCGWWWPFSGAVVLTPKPSRLSRDAENRLHCEEGPAVAYPDGFGIWVWHGVRVPRKVIESPSAITFSEIESEWNVEIRRVMVERYGQVRYLVDSGAKEIHRDDWGVLYRKDQGGDEPLVMVKVVNATREPDGSYKDYWLRVPPDVTTARQAVAWTFTENELGYDPLVQT